MKKITKILAIVLALLMVLPALAACDKGGNETEKPSGDPTEAPSGETTPEPEAKDYTYRLTMAGTPATWNPHTWENNAESELMSYIEGIPVDVSMDENGYYMWVYEMVTAVTDVTNTWEEAANWLPEGAEGEGWIYKLDLNPAAKWQDGTPINADTYIYSMQQCISSEMKNYRANSYTTSESAIKNALGYFNNDKVGQNMYADARGAEGYVRDQEAYYVSVDADCVFFGGPAKDYYENENYKPAFMDENGTDLYADIWGREANEEGFIQITEEDIAKLLVIAANFGDTNPEAWYEFCFYVSGVYEETPWEDVGLIKGDDYTLYYVLEQPESMFYFLTSLTGGWLVTEELYDAGKTTTGDLVTTNYGTAVDNYSASGPYKLTAFEPDKSFTLERNENWYGWTDGKHEGQYMTTKVTYTIVTEHATEVMLFKQGALDEIQLTSDDMEEFRASDNLLKTDQTYTYRWIFATDLEALEQLENEANDGANKKILAYDDFRFAISLAVDRSYLCRTCTPGLKPAYYLLNSLYYYDIENNPESRYRDTDEAKEAVLRIYDMTYGEGTEYATLDDAYAAVTGYDVEEAKALFQAAADKAIAYGNYTAGQPINITCEATALQSLTTDYVNECQYLNEAIAAATEGTDIGTVTITYLANCSTRYADVATGKVEMARGAWGGAAFYPFSTIRVYCEPDYMGDPSAIHEACGFNPAKETIVIPINGEDRTDTYQNWAKSINGAGEFANDPENAMIILSYLESNLVRGAHMIPFACDATIGLFSYKIKYATLDYDIMYGYGGIRLMTYNYDDAAWDAFVAENGGTLDYT